MLKNCIFCDFFIASFLQIFYKMATFKAEVLPHQKKRDGTYNIKIRIYHNRGKKYLSTPFFVKQEHLSQRGNIKSTYYINKCNELIDHYRKRVEELGYQSLNMTCDELVDYITTDHNEKFELNFLDYWKTIAERKKAQGRISTSKSFDLALRNFKSFIRRDFIDINEIDAKLLQSWIDSIEGKSVRHHYPSMANIVYNKAKKEYNDEDLGIILIPRNPFKKVEIPNPNKPKDRCLTFEDLQKIINYECKNKTTQFAKDVFLLSFCLFGMNIIDLYTVDVIKNGRLEYNRTKTKNNTKNGSFMSVKIEPEVESLFEKYKDVTGERVFSFYKKHKQSVYFNNIVNVGLKIIQKDLGIRYLIFYSARHTWASLAYNECDIDKYVVHQALAHSTQSMSITDVYIKKDFAPLDKANRKVLDYVFKNPTKPIKE